VEFSIVGEDKQYNSDGLIEAGSHDLLGQPVPDALCFGQIGVTKKALPPPGKQCFSPLKKRLSFP
jgi:hypothetical protein